MKVKVMLWLCGFFLGAAVGIPFGAHLEHGRERPPDPREMHEDLQRLEAVEKLQWRFKAYQKRKETGEPPWPYLKEE